MVYCDKKCQEIRNKVIPKIFLKNKIQILGKFEFLQSSGRYLTKYGHSEVLNRCNQAARRPPSPCLVEKYVSRSSVQKKSWLGRRAPCHAPAPVYQACPAVRCTVEILKLYVRSADCVKGDQGFSDCLSMGNLTLIYGRKG